MAKCINCGKRGLFLKLNNGYCEKCYHEIKGKNFFDDIIRECIDIAKGPYKERKNRYTQILARLKNSNYVMDKKIYLYLCEKYREKDDIISFYHLYIPELGFIDPPHITLEDCISKKIIDSTSVYDKDDIKAMLHSIIGLDEKIYDAISAIYDYSPKSHTMLQEVLNVSYVRSVELLRQLEILGFGFVTKEKEFYPLIKKNEWKRYCLEELSKKTEYIKSQLNEEAFNYQNVKIGITANEVEKELKEVDKMSGYEFEDWSVTLLKANGFTNVILTERSNDQGVDIIAKKNGLSYAIQCKCYSSKLGNKSIQEVTTGRIIYNCDRSLVITNSYFTDSAYAAAKATKTELWDRDTLIPFVRNLLKSKTH